MARITVTLYDESYEKINLRAANKNLTLTTYLRQLIELGLRIEEMSEQKSEQEDKADPVTVALANLKKVVQKDFLASQEALYLSRYILSHTVEKQPGDNAKMLEAAKLKAQSLLEVLDEEFS